MSLGGLEAGRSVGRYLGVTLRETGSAESPPVVEGTLPVTPGVRSPAGGLTAGALAGAVDSVGGLCAGLAALPRWVVSTNLHLSLVRPAHEGVLRMRSQVLRVGRDAVVTDVLVGEESAPVARGILTSAVLTPAAGPPSLPRPVEMVTSEPAGSTTTPYREFFAISPGEAPGVCLLDLRDHLRNPWGILHGVAIVVLVDDAAVRLGELVFGRPAVTTTMTVQFLRPARIGPVEARAEAAGTPSARTGPVVRIELRDLGADRTVALATARLRAWHVAG